MRQALTLVAIVALGAVALSQVGGWSYRLLRDFAIPVAGGPALTSRTDWTDEANRLHADLTAFWQAALPAYVAPELIAPLEGSRPACGTGPPTDIALYCPKEARIELNRIGFNGISRRAPVGLNHLAVAYVMAHLTGLHVQTQGAGTAGEAPDDAVAACLAGYWLRHGTAAYGTISSRDLSRAVRSATLGGSAHDAPSGASVPALREPPTGERRAWIVRGFRADAFGACAR